MRQRGQDDFGDLARLLRGITENVASSNVGLAELFVHGSCRGLVAESVILARGNAIGATLQWLAYAFPLTYAYNALSRATRPGPLGGTFILDVAMVIGATLAALALGAATLRRRTA